MLIGLAFSALPLVYPNQFSHHAKIVWGFLAAGMLLFLIEGVARVMQRSEALPSAVAPEAASSATGNQVTVNVHPQFATATPRATQPSFPVMSVLPRPQFRIRVAEMCQVVLVGGDMPGAETMVRFREPLLDERGEKCLALEVTNQAAEEGKQSRPARCVFATLEFKVTGFSGKSTLVNRACWINRESNEIPIGLSETEHILVGLPKTDKWIVFHNPNRAKPLPRVGRRVVTDHPLEERIVNWGQNASYVVEVAIISSDSGATHGMTLARRSFSLEHDGVSFRAKMLL